MGQRGKVKENLKIQYYKICGMQLNSANRKIYSINV